MRYTGDGVGHAAIQIQMQRSNDEDEMDIDQEDDDAAVGLKLGRDVENRLQEDKALLEELHQVANTLGAGGMASHWDEMEELLDLANEDSDDETSENEGSKNDVEIETLDAEDRLGLEDGKDEDYLDTGYGAL